MNPEAPSVDTSELLIADAMKADDHGVFVVDDEPGVRDSMDTAERFSVAAAVAEPFARVPVAAAVPGFSGIVGRAPSLQNLLAKIARVGPTKAAVLITGETGTGKGLVAAAIHRCSLRASHPMISANLAAMPVDLVSSELFGHEAGAFTGAQQRRIGCFEAADSGTLFLDEVGELPLSTQVTLLRVLQQGEFQRIGSGHSRRADVRIIAATNRDLGEALRQGSFRSDLFYRLAVFPIHLPALRQRREDIPLLAEYFLAGIAKRHGRTLHRVEVDSMKRLVAHEWLGNIRELQNVLEHSVILSEGTEVRVPAAVLALHGGVRAA